MIGALLLGLVCGAVARMLVPNDAFRHMSGPKSWLGLGIGDDDIFDWGGLLSALIGTIIVVPIATWILRRRAQNPT